MNKLEVGMYAYIKDSRDYGIGVIKKFEWGIKEQQVEIQFKHSYHSVPQSEVIGSFNPIDLIRELDYVNGYCVVKVEKVPNEEIDRVIRTEIVNGRDSETLTIYKEDIKSIVTKEQFKSISYEVSK